MWSQCAEASGLNADVVDYQVVAVVPPSVAGEGAVPRGVAVEGAVPRGVGQEKENHVVEILNPAHEVD